MSNELHRKARPKILDDVVGQPAAVNQMSVWMKKDKVPHVTLFTGPSGCGKTTLARILATHLNPSVEPKSYNCADFKGIDTVREIRQQIVYKARNGGNRVYIIDECFPGQTVVSHSNGRQKTIKQTQVGDWVETCDGISQVSFKFENKVQLSRIVRLKFSDGTVVFTTKEHKFLTTEGWVPAQNLKNDHCIFRGFCYTMQKSPENEDFSGQVNLPVVPKTIHTGKQEEMPVLFPFMRSETKTKVCGEREAGKEEMFDLRGNFSDEEGIFSTKNVREGVWGEAGDDQPQKTTGCSQQGGVGQDSEITHREEKSSVGSTDETSEPHEASKEHRQDGQNKDQKRNSEPSNTKPRGKRSASLQTSENSVEETGQKLAVGVHRPDKQKKETVVLQHRHSQTEVQGGGRGRWEFPSIEKEFLKRRKEDSDSRTVRLDSYQSYQPGCNDETFQSAVTDQERNQGFAVFYDLEICGHPSYFVEGLPVHNCHQLTTAAQDAFLKNLEEPPDHVYFMLCTTDPAKLVEAVKTRCKRVEVKILSRTDMVSFLLSLCKRYKLDVSKKVVERIADVSNGSPRTATIHLDAVSKLKRESDQLDAVLSESTETKVKDLFNAMLPWKGKPVWSSVAKVLDTLDEDPETLRRILLSLAGNAMLKGERMPVMRLVLNALQDPTWGIKALLIRACDEIVNTKV